MMAHQLFHVVAFHPGGWRAYPIVDGTPVTPSARTYPDGIPATAVVLGPVLQHLIPPAWIEAGNNDLREEFKTAQSEIEAVFAAQDAEANALSKAANDAAVAKSREEAAKKEDDNDQDAKPVETSTETVTEVIKPKPTKKK